MSTDASRSRLAAFPDRAAAVVAGLLFLVASVRFGGSVAGDELDPSWTMVLRWASLHGLRWGSDIAFTYGPLGYLSPLNACDPRSYGLFVATQIALAGAAAFLFANAWFAQRWPERVVLTTVTLFAAPLLAADPVWLSAPVLAIAGMHAHAVAGRRRLLWLLLVVAALYAATILLIKMSTLLLVVAGWLAGTVVLLHAGLRRHALVWLLLVPLGALLLWTLSGQRFADLLPFVSTVWEISRGYTGAMSRFPPLRFDLYGLAVLAGIGIVGLSSAWRARRDLARLACIALCGVAIVIAWRAGFTRADTHIAIFALTVWLVLPLLAGMAPGATRGLRAASLILALAVVPLADRTVNAGASHEPGDMAVASIGVLAHNAFVLVHPLHYGPALDAALDRERARLDLPLTRAAVGQRTVDLLGTQQGVVIINGFNYRPPPVFQGYGAYTPRLQRLNAAAYRGPDRTDFVLLAYSPIDGNLPTSENALAFTTLYANYHPALVEKSYLLLEKDADEAPPLRQERVWQRTTWGEWNALPTASGSVAVLAVRSDLSLAGQITASVLREPGQIIELELADGTTRRFRLVRGAAAGGFLVSPLLQSLDDYVSLFVGAEDLPAVRRFRLLPQSDAQRMLFANGIHWNVTPLPRRPRMPLPPTMVDARYPGFAQAPQSATAGVRVVEVEGRRALFLHSPAQLTFRPGAGRYVVSGEIGIVPNAFTTAACRSADGVEITLSAGSGPALAYPYDPFADAGLRPARGFELGPVETGADGALRLDVTPGPAGNGDCDWAYLRDVRLRALENG